MNINPQIMLCERVKVKTVNDGDYIGTPVSFHHGGITNSGETEILLDVVVCRKHTIIVFSEGDIVSISDAKGEKIGVQPYFIPYKCEKCRTGRIRVVGLITKCDNPECHYVYAIGDPVRPGKNDKTSIH